LAAFGARFVEMSRHRHVSASSVSEFFAYSRSLTQGDRIMSRILTTTLFLVGLGIALAGCGHTTGERAVSGGLIGAGAGAGIAAVTGGNPLAGAAIGGAAGAVTGVVTK
jgi:osmotically inducible lipoprotein OsmB